ncbi:hypothetical protein GCM10017559_25690 [Streptosporangium longisporum]|uniref:Uncharacterized protein n=1 Tax=Streptosporangium longisporum TaxID=46187 RepID=A0ABP6KD99_9ACTN
MDASADTFTTFWPVIGPSPGVELDRMVNAVTRKVTAHGRTRTRSPGAPIVYAPVCPDKELMFGR